MKDSYGRDINYLRISLTENCNLRCIYCLPENYSFEHKDILSKEDVLKTAEAGAEIGIKKIRLTGGEPLLRDDIIEIIQGIKSKGIDEIYLTTNGILLKDKAEKLKKAGLCGVNVSLDTLDEKIFSQITRGGKLSKTLEGIEKALECGLEVKINAVIMRGINESSIKSLAELTKEKNIHVRFIELMPIGQGKNFIGVSNKEVYNLLQNLFQFDENFIEIKGVSEYRKIKNHVGKIGFISPMNSCFCDTCNKIRVMSDGNIKRCLNRNGHINIKEILRKNLDENAEKEALKKIFMQEIMNKPEKHLFGKENDDEELKNMNQIGG